MELFARKLEKPEKPEKLIAAARREAYEKALAVLNADASPALEIALTKYWILATLPDEERNQLLPDENAQVLWRTLRDLVEHFFKTEFGISVDLNIRPNSRLNYSRREHTRVGPAREGNEVYAVGPRIVFTWKNPVSSSLQTDLLKGCLVSPFPLAEKDINNLLKDPPKELVVPHPNSPIVI